MNSTKRQEYVVSVLIADDEAVSRKLFSRYLENAGFKVMTARNGEEALAKMTPEIRVAVLDLNMPGMGGLECLKQIRQEFPLTEVLIISGVGQIDDAVAAMKAGACEFVTKPCENDDLVARVRQAVRASNLSRDNRQLRHAVQQPISASRFAISSESAKTLMQRVVKLAELDSTVLLTGESGTGKTTIARMIHDQGSRSAGPFISVNCASLPRDLIEAELFGFVKGAFQGATEDRPGRAEIADGGTLFLDEIGDLPLELQPKLLTFLQDSILKRIGSNREIKVDVRLITATHQDLEEMSSQRRFRPDLYYRLNVLHLGIPPLRERRKDIPEMAGSILARIQSRRGGDKASLDAKAIHLLQQLDWPGNVRELENVLERASAFCDDGQITVADLEVKPTAVSQPQEASMNASLAGLTLKEIEKRALIDTLEANGGNKAMAARVLGISEKSIYNKLRRFDLFKSK
ncbi:MAG: sigma-54-dependent Fis family transcriptional regulator [Planctomycetaceae bacterium]|nr:sigma-54-dependent Fis family transcriptional regulator [Planctomycetaceae bacterium]